MQIERPDYNSPAALKAFLEMCNMTMQKKFGQNFLINESARKRLITALDLHPETTIWEVGPGLGAMTAGILNTGAILTAFEIDRGFSSLLPRFFYQEAQNGHFTLVEGDVLKTWKNQYVKRGVPQRFFGNLPYNVAATIIADMISDGVRFEKAVVTVQKEVAIRMTAKPAEADYSSFSILCQWAYFIIPILDLTGGNFWPRPNVDSRAVLMMRKNDFPGCQDARYFMQMQRALFASRRKTIKNNLTQFLSDSTSAEKALKAADINPSVRAETLSIQELLHLADCCIAQNVVH